MKNIKFSIYKFVLDSDTGIMYQALVASGFTGYFEDITGTALGKVMGPGHESTASAQFKLIVDLDPVYTVANNVYRNNVETYFKAGYFVRITHRIHPRLNIWVETQDEHQYKIDYIQLEDKIGNRYIASLKDEPNV